MGLVEVMKSWPEGKKRVCGKVWTGIALVCVLTGFALFVATSVVLDSALHQALIVDSYDSQSYGNWIQPGRDNTTKVPIYFAIRIFDLLNAEAVLAGKAKPRFHELGPFVYKEHNDKIDVKFYDNGNMVYYQKMHQYFFQPQLSMGGDPTKVMVTNINPTYMAVLSQAGSETLLPLAAIAPTIGKIADFLEKDFSDAFVAEHTAATVASVYATLVKQAGSEEHFCDTWANAKYPPSTEWIGMLLANGQEPTQVDAATCHSLFDANTKQSLAATDRGSTWLWSKAFHGDAAARKTIHTAFPGLSDKQFDQVVTWFQSSFKMTKVVPPLLDTWSALDPPPRSIQDLAYLQWGSANVIQRHELHSLKEWFPDAWPAEVEVGWWSHEKYKIPQKISWTGARKLLSGPYGIRNPINMIDFAKNTVHPSVLKQKWGLDVQEAVAVESYLAGWILPKFAALYTKQAVEDNSGVFIRRSVDEWFWSGHDSLKELFTGEAGFSVFRNDTTMDIARAKTHNWDMWTGKDNINKLNEVVKWNHKTSHNFYVHPEPVKGSDTEGFHPYVQPGEKLLAFISETGRSVDLVPTGDDVLHGIDVVRYELDPTFFSPNPNYYMQWKGYANLTSLSQGAPIFMSKPHFLDADPRFLSRVSGLSPDRSLHDTHLMVEPVTGKVFSARKRLQVNLYAPPDPDHFVFNLFNPDMPADTMFPLCWVQEYGDVDEDTAAKFRHTVYAAMEAEPAALLGGLLFGLMAAAPASLLFAWARLDKQDAEQFMRGSDREADDYYQQLLSEDESKIARDEQDRQAAAAATAAAEAKAAKQSKSGSIRAVAKAVTSRAGSKAATTTRSGSKAASSRAGSKASHRTGSSRATTSAASQAHDDAAGVEAKLEKRRASRRAKAEKKRQGGSVRNLMSRD